MTNRETVKSLHKRTSRTAESEPTVWQYFREMFMTIGLSIVLFAVAVVLLALPIAVSITFCVGCCCGMGFAALLVDHFDKVTATDGDDD